VFTWNFLLILLLIAVNAFFVSVEFAAVASRKARIEILAEEGNAAARIVKSWLENPSTRDRMIAASQIGITMVGLALGAIGENTFQELLQPIFSTLTLPDNLEFLTPFLNALPLILSLLIITTLLVVLGEMVPKVATLQQPERIAMLSAQPMKAFTTVFKWFIDILDWATKLVLRIFGLKLVGEHALI